MRARTSAGWARLAAALGLGVALGSAALAGEQEAIFERFDHAAHEKALVRAKVGCVACHQVGAPAAGQDAAQLAATWLGAPKAVCHECHAPGEGALGVGPGQRGAPRACGSCHAETPRPDTHVAGWVQHHGLDATASGATCRDCHERSDCVDCHDRRENSEHRVHDPTWLTVHGIEARANPGACDSCHVQAECTSCHQSGLGFGRTP